MKACDARRRTDIAGSKPRSTSFCDLEVGYSARSATEWDQLLLALDALGTVD